MANEEKKKFKFRVTVRGVLMVLTAILVGIVIYQNWPDMVQAFHDLRKANAFVLLLLIPEQLVMYYSCGQTFIKDCGFSEPTHISFAESEKITTDYISREKPIISPDKNIPYLNLCSGCMKVYKLSDCYIGLQNGIFEKDGKSHSAIVLLRSDDGIKFDFVKHFLTPQVCGENKWMAQFVYACCLTYYDGTLRLYFNARNAANILTGRESIGVYYANL